MAGVFYGNEDDFSLRIHTSGAGGFPFGAMRDVLAPPADPFGPHHPRRHPNVARVCRPNAPASQIRRSTRRQGRYNARDCDTRGEK